jgi:protein tyrosine phosphatase
MLQGYKGKDNFVATQWPMEDTVVDFWRLVKDHGVQHIVLLEELSLQVSQISQVLRHRFSA